MTREKWGSCAGADVLRRGHGDASCSGSPNSARMAWVCCPSAGTAPIAAVRPGTVTGGRSARSGPVRGIDVPPPVPGRQLRVGGELLGAAHPGVGDTRRLQRRFELVHPDPGEHPGEDRGQLVVVRDPGRVGREPLIGDQVRAAQDPLAQHHPLALVLDAQEHLATLGRVGPVRGDRGVPRPGARRGPAAVDAVVVGLAHPFAQRVEHGHLEAAAPPGPLPLVQRGQHAGVGVHPGRDVGHRDAGLGRLVRRPGDGQQPGLALHQQVVGLLAGVRAVRAIPRDRAADQPRITGGELLRRPGRAARPRRARGSARTRPRGPAWRPARPGRRAA